MKYQLINFAKKIYFNTPWQWLRSIYFFIFSTLVRNRKVEASIDGINYYLDLGENIDLHVYLNRYEPDMSAIIPQVCQSGFIVLDIGANIGAYALRFSKIIGVSGRVYAFEPTDYAYKKLINNISLNESQNIIPLQLALSDKNLSQQVIRFRSSWPTRGKHILQESKVDFIKLDDWFKNENIKNVNLVKLDVDGNEYAVIKGGESLLTSQRPIILMEVWGPNFSDDFKNPFSLLQQWGYRFYDIATGNEYIKVDDLRARVSSEEKLLDCSFNIVARF